LQEKILKRLSKSLYLAIEKSKVIPKTMQIGIMSRYSIFPFSNKNLNKMIKKIRMKMWFVFS
jgi:hypothetical protein